MSDKILPFLFENGDDISALDLLLDIEKLSKLHKFITVKNYSRIFEYLIRYIDYSSSEEETKNILDCLFTLSTERKDSLNSMLVAIK